MLLKFRPYIEPVIWMVALLLLFFMDNTGNTPSFCLFKRMGFTHCPGCGIGHAMHDALHLRFEASLQEHLLGIPALAIIGSTIIKSFFNIKKTDHYGPARTPDDATRHAAG